MSKTLTGAIGAVAAVALCNTAPAEAQPGHGDPYAITSYADLLEPVQNAVEVLKADDAARPQRGPLLEQVQYYYHHHHHHWYHHHHHHWYRPYYHHHNWYRWHHHHHRYRWHHHHHHNWRNY